MSYKELVDFTVKEFGGPDGLFNVAADLSAGTVGRDSDVISIPLDVWRHTIDVMLTGYMYGIRHALPIMIERGSGAIVNTTSSIVWLGEAQRVAYQAAKAGLYGLTRHTATLGGKRGVRCNSVAPGVTLTRAVLENLSDEYRARSSQMCSRLDSDSQRTSLRWWRSCSPTMLLTSTARRSSSTAGEASPEGGQLVTCSMTSISDVQHRSSASSRNSSRVRRGSPLSPSSSYVSTNPPSSLFHHRATETATLLIVGKCLRPVGASEVVLGGLSDADARELLRSALPGRFDDRVLERLVVEAQGTRWPS